MLLHWVPLLQIARDLHTLPRGPARFDAYLRAILNRDRTAPALAPLVMMNPMGKDYVAAILDACLALDAERIAAEAMADAAALHAETPGEFRVGLVVVDDAMGGWTNRAAVEFQLICAPPGDWLSVVLWSSEPASADAVREAARIAVHRAAHHLLHGVPRTLGATMAQEGRVRALSGCTQPALDADDLEYTRAVVAPFLDAEDMRTQIECLFGDALGGTLGFTPHGLSDRAGLALALHDARAQLADHGSGRIE